MNLNKILPIIGLLFFTVTANLFTQEANVFADNERNGLLFEDPCSFTGCNGELELRKLTAAHVKGGCVDACRLKVARDLCADSIKAKSICVENLSIAQNQTGAQQQICLPNTVVNGDLCVSGTARLGNICQDYRATVTLVSDTVYTLGTFLPYDNIVDDPDGDVSLSPLSYTVPATGYYILTVQTDQNSLMPTPPNPILGTPTADIDIYINGVKNITTEFPYLTFSNEQRSTATTLIILNAGDVVQFVYRVVAIDPTLGQTDVNGTVVLESGALNCLFSIHFLSSLCSAINCVTDCAPCSTTCNSECFPDRP